MQPGEHALFFPACVRVIGDQSTTQGEMIAKCGERYEFAHLLLSRAYLPCIQHRLQEPGT